MAQRSAGAARRAAGVLVVAAALAGTGACGAPTSAARAPLAATPVAGAPDDVTPAAAAAGPAAAGGCSAFALSLVSDRGGRPSPVAAAEWFSTHGGVPGVPPGGWQPGGTDDAGATVRSGAVTLHVVRGPDGTWQVDSGRWC